VRQTCWSNEALLFSVEVESTLAKLKPPLTLGVWTLMPAAMRVVFLTWSRVDVSVLFTLRVLYRKPPRVRRVAKMVPYSR
jgi:hypothetical protein